jgi:hypothetical protein
MKKGKVFLTDGAGKTGYAYEKKSASTSTSYQTPKLINMDYRSKI